MNMKKYLSVILLGLLFTNVQSQEVSDALRYAQTNLNGTARFRAMSGAFGALGGDLSSITVNPAGSVVFANNFVGGSLSDFVVRNNSNYLGTKNSTTKNSLDLNQAGGVFVFKNDDKHSDWKTFALSLNYENASDFTNSIFSSGTNINSIDKYFLSYANSNNGVPLNFLITNTNETVSQLYSYLGNNLPLNSAPNIGGFQAQQALLGFQGYIIDNVLSTSTRDVYASNVRFGGNYKQENSYVTRGYNGKLSFNASGQYQNWLSVGLNLNSHFNDYKQSTSFYESNSNNLDSNIRVKNARFNNELHTFGTGFSLQIGAIAKINKEFRAGLSYESPTWYELNDELTQSLTATSSSTAGVLSPDVVNPNVTNVYEPYKLQTPSKYTGSLAYVFGKRGLISVDYSVKDYSNTKFKPLNEFERVNSQMTKLLSTSAEFRVGAEYRIKLLSLRAGYRTEQSPYKDKKIMGDLYGISGGFGYDFGGTKLDLSYAYAKRSSQQQFFSQGFTDYSNVNTITNNITVTLGFEL
jgi:hypothetical protein